MLLVLESRFSTDLLPAKTRFESWRESIGVLYDVKQSVRTPADSFYANVHGYLFDNMMIVRCRTSAQEFRRSPVNIAQDGVDHYMIQLFLAGGQQVTRGRREAVSGPGDIIIYDLAAEHYADTSNFDNLSIILPRRLLGPLLQQPDNQNGRIFGAEEPLTRILSHYMRDLYELSGTITDEQRKSLDGVTSSLIAATLNGSGGEPNEYSHAVTSSVLLHAKHVLDRFLHEPNLDALAIAKAVGVSRAGLYRLFEPYGGVMNYVRRRRLYRSLRVLMDPMQRNRTIADIAFGCGFTSEAHFSRVFRKQFKMSPSEVRQQEGVVPVGSWSVLEDDRVGDRNYETWILETLLY